MLLSNTGHFLQLYLSSGYAINVQSSWVDRGSSEFQPGDKNYQLSTTGYHTIVESPASGFARTISSLRIYNAATQGNILQVRHYDGTSYAEVCTFGLSPKEFVQYDGKIFQVYNTNGYLITIGMAGPSGSVGPQGPQGPQGLTGSGVAGPQGATGPSGAIGLTGPSGATGPQGPQGDVGATGPIGPSGATGPQGPQGFAGPSGATGPQGPQGSVGSTGPAGPSGATGPQGPQGSVGATGPAGPSGATGPQGAIGPSGATGPAGSTSISGLVDTNISGLIVNQFLVSSGTNLFINRGLLASDIPSHNQSWSTITSTPTTVSGYGITDASMIGHKHSAADTISGIFATARLGSGTANSTTALFGNSQWNPLNLGLMTDLQSVTANPSVPYWDGGAWDVKDVDTFNFYANQIVSGIFAPSVLASGTANSGVYLRGDGVWASIPNSARGILVEVNFGTGFQYFAQTVVTGQVWMDNNTKIACTCLASSGQEVEAALLSFSPVISDIVPGTGFTLNVYTPVTARGNYYFNCLGV